MIDPLGSQNEGKVFVITPQCFFFVDVVIFFKRASFLITLVITVHNIPPHTYIPRGAGALPIGW